MQLKTKVDFLWTLKKLICVFFNFSKNYHNKVFAVSLWLILICLNNSPLVLVENGHLLQINGIWSEWIWTCLVKLYSFAYALLHRLQVKVLGPDLFD